MACKHLTLTGREYEGGVVWSCPDCGPVAYSRGGGLLVDMGASRRGAAHSDLVEVAGEEEAARIMDAAFGADWRSK
ncbi:MAG: hypothetical protein H7Z12_18595 [Rhodospirillaceae bacterium]|nr:hypothetical protein [Rhodospirillales bacterium]